MTWDRATRILNSMEPDTDYTSSELAYMTKGSTDEISNSLKKLIASGHVVCIGVTPCPDTHYRGAVKIYRRVLR